MLLGHLVQAVPNFDGGSLHKVGQAPDQRACDIVEFPIAPEKSRIEIKDLRAKQRNYRTFGHGVLEELEQSDRSPCRGDLFCKCLGEQVLERQSQSVRVPVIGEVFRVNTVVPKPVPLIVTDVLRPRSWRLRAAGLVGGEFVDLIFGHPPVLFHQNELKKVAI